MKLSELTGHPQNPRKISKEKLAMLEKSLKEFGDLSGIIYNRKTGHLVGGHQRQKVLPKDVEIIQDSETHGHFDLNGDRFHVRFVEWDETKEKAANISANQHGGDWDLPQLSDWINELDSLNIDLDLLGFDKDELANIMAPTIAYAGNCDEDEIPEKVPAKTHPGDLYQLGEHRLLCGDSTNIQHVERLMNGEKADMVFTDPPYGMGLDTNYDDMYAFGDHTHTGNRFKKVEGDDKSYDPNPILSIKSKRTFIWGADYFYNKLPDGGCFIAWDKRTESLDKVPGNTTEFCWSYPPTRRTSCRIIWSGYYGMTGSDAGKRMHPTQKPIKLAEWFFEHWGKETKNVVDIYLGSGSTLIACEKTKRKCFGMEIDPYYCDIIVARWERFSGKQSKLIDA